MKFYFLFPLIASGAETIDVSVLSLRTRKKRFKKFPPAHETRLSQTPRKRRLYRITRQKIANVSRFPLWIAGVSSDVASRDVMQRGGSR